MIWRAKDLSTAQLYHINMELNLKTMIWRGLDLSTGQLHNIDMNRHQDQGVERGSSSQIPGGAGKVSREPSGMHGSQQSAPVSKESGEEYRRKDGIAIVHPLQLTSPARQRPEPQAYPSHPQEPFLTIDDHLKLPPPRQSPEPQTYPSKKRAFLWCNVCSASYPNDKNAEQHFLWKKHKKNLLKLDEKKILRCELCNIYCRGHIEMAKHQNGKKTSF